MAHLGVPLEDSPKGGFIVRHNSKSSLVVKVKSKQNLDPLMMELIETFLSESNESFSQGEYGFIRHQRRLFVPDVDVLSELIMEEAHSSRYSIHPGVINMYRNL